MTEFHHHNSKIHLRNGTKNTMHSHTLLTGATAFSGSYFGRGTGGIFLDNVDCSGEEQYLIYCSHSIIGVHNCDHSKDAGVFCVPNYPGTWM